MKRRELTEEEVEDARRLRAAWDSYKSDNPGVNQEWLAKSAKLGRTGTQGAAGQYLRGVIPLNINAALRICNVLGVGLATISPRLAALTGVAQDQVSNPRKSGETLLEDSLKLTIETAAELRLLTVYRLANEEGRGIVDTAVSIAQNRLSTAVRKT